MEEELISFEVAKLAKEKGFKEACVNWYNFSGLLIKDSATKQQPSNNKKFPSYSAPTQALLQRWLRENWDIHIEPEKQARSYYHLYIYSRVGRKQYYTKEEMTNFSSYEKALEQGLIGALNLIK